MGYIIAEFAVALPAGIFFIWSLTIKNQKKFRLVNMLGCISFVIYGVLLVILSSMQTGWTTIALNSISIIVHIICLRKLKKAERCEEQISLGMNFDAHFESPFKEWRDE